MTIDEVASFCEFKDCQVKAGDPEQGYIAINGRGLDRDSYTWGRFSMFGEVKSPPLPEQVLKSATTFRIQRGDTRRDLTRQEFEAELKKFQRLVAD